MTPVRIKIYGLIPITKRRYIIQLIVAGVLVVFLLVAWWIYWAEVREKLKDMNTPILDLVVSVWNLIPWVVLGVIALQILEAYFVFRAFARKEKEATLASPTVPPPADDSAGKG